MENINIGAFCILLFFLILSITECGRAPALFIFGDSLVDNGNNNFIPSIARANYLPYGIDFGFPTGRFCNGLTVTDYAAQFLGLPFPVPYLSLQSLTAEILQGVNYASAAAGILDATGMNYGARVTFNEQIGLFEKTVTLQLPLLIPDSKKLSDFLRDSLFIIEIGSNDYINNYLLPDIYPSSLQYTPNAFADLLANNMEHQLSSLYRLGARKMVVVSLGPLGCIPSQLYMQNSINGCCIESINENATLLNQRLAALTVKLSSTLPGSFFVYQNTYDNFLDMVNNPARYGFTESNQACCGNGKYGGQLTCLPLQVPCLQRDLYIFWDSFHPTQATNKMIAERCYTPSASDCHPISGYQLAQI